MKLCTFSKVRPSGQKQDKEMRGKMKEGEKKSRQGREEKKKDCDRGEEMRKRSIKLLLLFSETSVICLRVCAHMCASGIVSA